MERRCGSCEFAALMFSGTVECRRMPPQAYFEPTGKVSNVRPRVGQEYWCGEFAKRDEPLHDMARVMIKAPLPAGWEDTPEIREKLAAFIRQVSEAK